MEIKAQTGCVLMVRVWVNVPAPSLKLQVVNKLGNLRRISCPGSRTGTRSPAGSEGWSPRSQTFGAAGDCSWLQILLVNPEMMQFSPDALSKHC